MNPFEQTPEQEAAHKAQRYAMYAQHREDEARFFSDTEKHTMKVLQDNGVYRHLSFSNGGSSVYRFDLVTFPGYLVYTGDMGSFTFRRLTDMFEFFRTDRVPEGMDVKLAVNHGYWSEKLVATDCNGKSDGKCQSFDVEKMKGIIYDYLLRWIRDAKREETLTKDERRELWEAVRDELLGVLDDDESTSYSKVHEFSWKPGGPRGRAWTYRDVYRFEDFYEHSFRDFTHSFRWACLAISWSVQQYDTSKDAK